MRPDWAEATASGAIDRVRALLAAGADVDATDRHGQTALMNAARAGQADLVSLLVARGAALDRTAKYGLSALMLAVVSGQAAVVRLLVAADADLGLRGQGAPGFHGKTALDLATDMRHQEIAAMLRAAGAPAAGPD